MDKAKQVKAINCNSCLERGKELFQKGNYLSAIEQYRKILDIHSEDKQALFEMGKAYYVLEKYLLAIKLLNKATILQPDNIDAHLLLAKAYKSVGRYDDSIVELTKLKESGCDNLDVDRELTSVYRERYSGLMDISKFNGKYDLAIKEYEERLKTNPKDEKSISHLVQLYNFEGKYELTREKIPPTLRFIPKENTFFKNKLLNELEIAQGETVLSSKVRSLVITLSNKCNLSCIMCLTRNVPWELPEKIIKEIFALFPYLEKIMWQGGEVFVLDYFEEILSAASQYPNLRQSIVTNGLLITEKMAEKLVKNNVELTFSIDGVTKETYEYIRRGANFEILIRNLNLILELRKRHNSNMILNLNVAIMKSNYRQLENFIDFAQEYGFGFVCLMPIHIHLKTPEDIFTNQDIEALSFITEVSPKIEEKAQEYGIRLENRLPTLNSKNDNSSFENDIEINPQKKFLCHIPWQQLYIDYDGSVRPDCLCKIQKSAGSLLKNLSLEEIWNNQVMQEYRRKIVNHDYLDLCNPACISGKIFETHLKFP